MTTVEVKNLIKDYGVLRAVDGIGFSIEEGEIFGMVGPNGAGKTTTIECIEGLRKPDGGTINVLGLEPYKEREKLYELIGVQLTEKKTSYVSRLSGGQKQKLSIILALVSNPKIVFLDELTTGLDPQARHSMWKLIKGLRDEGRTVFLTTHYMEEAEYLCGRVAIMDHGKIVALDTPHNLIESSGMEERINFEGDVPNIGELKNVKEVLNVQENQGEVTVYGKGADLLQNVVSYLQAKGINYRNLQTRTPNIEDAFLKLTGRKYEGDKA